MAYQKQTFINNETVLTAEMLNHIEQGIVDNETAIGNKQNKGNYALKSELPTKTSQLTNDSGFMTSYTETDPTVPAWARAASKPTYTKSEVGLSNVDNVKQYSASNPPPYPVTSVNGKTGAVTVDVPTKLSDLTSDATHRTVTDTEKNTWNNKSNFSGAYADLTGKPTIPTVPTKVSAFTNDVGYQTAEDVQSYAQPKGNYATTNDVNDLQQQIYNTLDDDDISVEETETGSVVTIGSKTVNIENGKDGTIQIEPLFAESLEWLEENGDTSKVYILPDGFIYAYMLTKKEVESGGGYTNAFKEYGYNINKRWSHSSKALSTANGYVTTNLIPVRADQTVYINKPYLISGGVYRASYSRVTYYGDDSLYVAGELDRAIANKVVITAENDNMSSFVVGYMMTTAGTPSTNARMSSADSIRYMRLVLNIGDDKEITEADVADLIISVGNPIVEGGGTEIVEEYAWASTGHNFVAGDYEDAINTLEERTLRHTEEISALQKAVEDGSGNTLTDSEKLAKIKTWDKPVYDFSPVTLIADDRVKPALITADRTVEAIYAKYRALMAQYPDYITETNMGKCTSSDTFTAVDMLRFDFKEPDGLTQPDLTSSALHETKPKIIFMSGVHTEWVGVWGLYYALEEIATNPDFDDIRRNAHIIVIPCANPYCLAWETAIDGWRMSHVNANGVAIHNNFNVDHKTSGAVGEYNYGGSAPCSELETQYIDKVMADNPDAVAFVSCHNNDYSTYYGSHVIWASSATYHMCNVAFRLVDKMSKAWIDKYGQTLKDAIDNYKINMDANDYRLGRATMSSSAGTEQKNATKYGIQGVNVEISRMMKVFSGNTDGTSEVMTHGAEVYANLMRTLLTAYNHTDKEEYYK